MKRLFESANVFVAMMLLGFSFCFASCSDDDDEPKVSPEVMLGEYYGTMSASSVAPESETEEPSGVKVTAKLDGTSVCFDNLPVKDIVLSIVGDEAAADQIMEALGNVEYKIAYNPVVNADGNIISLAFNAEPLKMSMTIPSAIEGEEALTINIEVAIDAKSIGIYTVDDGNLKFELVATKVLVGSGEEMTEMDNFAPTTFAFDLFQNRIYS